jgi:hypothetical protein
MARSRSPVLRRVDPIVRAATPAPGHEQVGRR